MGLDALEGNGITRKLLYFLRDKSLIPADEPLRKVRKSKILLFVAVQLAAFGATMAITQTIGLIVCYYFFLDTLIKAILSCYRLPRYHHAPCTYT